MDQDRRLIFHQMLTQVPGIKKVYFQPPETVKLEYPCIIYEKQPGNSLYADDKLYKYTQRYTVLVIDRDPDSEIPEYIRNSFSHCRIDRNFIKDNLNHSSFTIYF